MLRVRIVLSLLVMIVGCDHGEHAWEGAATDAGAVASSQSAPRAVELLDADLPDAGPASDATAAIEASPTPPVRVGGPWVRCYGHFHPSGDPKRDVTRLGLLCGPENGMRRAEKAPFEGRVVEGAAPATFSFEAKRGECYRVFTAGDASFAAVDVVVRSSRGARVASAEGDDAWPIVQPDRPFCPLEDDRYTLEIVAKRGSGAFASEIWVLKSASKEPSKGVRSDAEN